MFDDKLGIAPEIRQALNEVSAGTLKGNLSDYSIGKCQSDDTLADVITAVNKIITCLSGRGICTIAK